MLVVNLSQDSSSSNKYISNTLLNEIEVSLKKKKKVILYLNKRGYFSSLVCGACQHLYTCNSCDHSFHVHSNPNRLICHICGATKEVPKKCTQCNSSNLLSVGVGTQQVENFLNSYFGNSIDIFRFDTDTMKNKSDKKQALLHLEKADIIIGTKMITTGFDFKNIGLIGVLLLEQELQIPKYNTKEKVYSNITQLIGRGGRSGEETQVVIQTFIPENDTIKTITEGNYKEFFKTTLQERKLFGYPPYSEMVILEYRHKNEEKTLDFLKKIHNKLLLEPGAENMQITLSPKTTKKYNTFHGNLIIKGPQIRNFLEAIRTELMKNSGFNIIFE